MIEEILSCFSVCLVYLHSNSFLKEFFFLLLNLDSTVIVHGLPDGSVVKNLPASAGETGDTGSIPGSGRSPR